MPGARGRRCLSLVARLGGVAALVTGAATYVLGYFEVVETGIAPVVVALVASALAMLVGGMVGPRESEQMLAQIETLHAPHG